MERREFLKTAALAVAPQGGERQSCDVFVYGSTPGGVAAAVEAARRGCRVVMACPKARPGGMAASGLSTTDAVRPHLFGGLVAEFIAKVFAEYRRLLKDDGAQLKLVHGGWYYEPSVAELIFHRLIEGEQDRLRWLPEYWLERAVVQDHRIREVHLTGRKGAAHTITARTFIDGTYEGDLAAAAKVPYRVGREGREEYGEPFAGIHYMNWRTGRQIMTPDTGEPSLAIQAFCARSIFTDDPAQRVPVEKPDTYEEHLQDYLPLRADFSSGRVKSWGWGTPLPRRKYQANGNIEALTSLNLPGASWPWPEAGRRHRERLEKFHVDHAAGLMYFLQNDPGVPDHIRNKMSMIGLHRQEFTDTGHWPWQIYVRQGRRIEGRAVVTQHNFTVNPKTGRTPRVDSPIAIGEHSFDVHPCHDRRYAVDGFMEGVLWYPKKAFGPAQPGQIPFGAMLPKNVDNLLAPVPMSSTHVAMSVLRMEPVWMTTGQIAGLAAARAQEQNLDVASIDPNPLPALLKIQVDPYA
ncbi:MAG: FAD-dependent oxidoreductase [Acidobacteriales bacterium]|nr:FAD-dependent oxidoreductase [Terriglobales bacterium]